MSLADTELRPAGGPLHRERLVSGQYEGCTYENCLDAALLPDGVRIGPVRWISGNPALELPFSDIVSIYVHPSRLTPRLEFIYRDWGGVRAAHIVPRNLHAWLRHLSQGDVPVRPAGLDLERIPRLTLHYLAHRLTLGAAAVLAGAGGVMGLLHLAG